MKQLIIHLSVLIVCVFVRVSSGLRFNKTLAHAIYSPWNGSTNGTLLFEFKTTSGNAFLMYEDEPGGMDFFDIFLIGGRARMRLQIGQCKRPDPEIDHFEEYIEGNFSDNKWHRVRVVREFKNTYFKVDQFSSRIMKCSNKDTVFKAKSSLFVVGFPVEISLNSLAFPGSFHEVLFSDKRFVGCVSGVKYSDSFGHFTSAVLLNTSGTTGDCKRSCTRHYEFIMKCKHGQRCGRKITECDCLETGYEGQDCTRASTSVWMNGTGYIKYNLPKDTKHHNTKKNYIGFRFRTSSKDGVFMHAALKDSVFLVLEMLKGSIVMKLDLGAGELVLTAGNDNLNDNRWHWVELKRRGREAILILDGRVTKKGRTPGTPSLSKRDSLSKLDLSTSDNPIYFGGGPSQAALTQSYSRKNFSGFLQQFRFDKYKILHKVLFNKQNKLFSKHGLVLDAKVWATKTPPTMAIKRPTEPETGSGNCVGTDDEDCVTPESITMRPTENGFYPSPQSNNSNTSPGIVYGNQHSTTRHQRIPVWVITITVVAAVVSIFITILIVYRWNTRYSGSFSTASANLKSDPPEPWPDPPPRPKPTITSTVPVCIEQPTIYVTSYDKV